jgi:CHAT domain-containing protein/predicted negative regulator of RcsB-dependent stress response
MFRKIRWQRRATHRIQALRLRESRAARRWLASIPLTVLLLLGGSGRANTLQSQKAIQSLQVGNPVDANLAGGQADDYDLLLSNSQFLRFTVAPKNSTSNIQVALFDPNGVKVEELSGPVCPFWLYFISVVSGTYHLHLNLSSQGATPEAYTVRIEELRKATDEDKTRISAGQALIAAFRQEDSHDPGSRQKATDKYEEAISLFRAINDRPSEADVFEFLSFRSFRARQFQAAADYARQAQALWHDLHERAREAMVLENMRMFFARLGAMEEAFDSANKAVVLRHALGDVLAEARDLSDRGDVYDAQGEFQNALNDKQRALSPFRGGKDRMEDEYSVLADLGHIEEELGEPAKALDYYEQALALLRSHADRSVEFSMLALIGGAYAGMGDRSKALDYYNQSLEAAKDSPGDEAWMQLKLADFYRGEEEYARALQLYAVVLPHFHADHQPAFEALSLYGIGVVYHKQGKWQQALESLNQSLSIWPMKNRTRRDILGEIGSVYQDAGDKPKALEYYEKSLSESRAGKDSQSEALALWGVAKAEHAMHENAEARRDIETGLNILESVRARLVEPESRSSYFAAAQKNYEFYINLLMEMHAEHPDAGLDAAAFQASERARARSLLDLLVEARVEIHKGVDPRLLERERTLQQRLRRRSEYQVGLLSRTHTPQQAESVANELQNLTAQYDETEAQIRVSSPSFATLTQPEPLTLKQVQESVLDSDTVLLEYALGEDRSYLWAITSSAVASRTLPRRGEIEFAARTVYDLLTARNRHPKGERGFQRAARLALARSTYPAAAARLSEMILGPVSSLLPGKRLVIVSDGALQYIPFAALPIPRRDKAQGEIDRPLVVESEIVSAPSASALAVIRREVGGRRPAPEAVAVIADPVFEADDPRVARAQEISQVRHGTGAALAGNSPTALERSWTDTASDEREWKIPRLPFSRREANAIIAAAPAGSRFEAVDFHANRPTATSSDLARYRFIHFATHGILDSRTPALSGIVLSLVDQRGKPQDGFLRLWDIYNLRLPAELVVLSSCQTALGKEIKGEGLVGLTRGFFYAGAARVIASLWNVDDVATAELMSHFYQNVLKNDLSAAAALRSAQIAMWKQKRWRADPYFWGAFQLQGEWK